MKHRALLPFALVLAFVLALAACPSPVGDDGTPEGEDPPGTFTYTIVPLLPNGGRTVDSTPILQWDDVFGRDGYELQLGDIPTEVEASVPIPLGICQYIMPSPLVNNSVTYWRVRAKNMQQVWGAWSSTFSFTYSSVPVIASALSDGGTTDDQTPLLDWEDPYGSVAHRIQIADSDKFSPVIEQDLGLATSQYQVTTSIPLGSTRYWRIRAQVDTGETDWSDPRAFTIQWNPTYTPLYPVDGSTTFDRTPQLDWATISGASSYEVQLASSAAGLDAATPVSVGPSYYNCPAIDWETTTYWRVRPVNSEGGKGTWSAAQSFTVTASYTASASAVDTSDTTPLLDWNDAGGMGSIGLTYDIEVETTSTFDGTGYTNVSSSSYTCPVIPRGSSRWWRVRARNDTGEFTAWSTGFTFTLDWTYTIAASSPADGSSTLDQTPLLNWNDVTDAASYEVAFSPTAIGLVNAKIIDRRTAAGSQYQMPVGDLVSFGESRVWAVRPVNSEGVKGVWGTAFSFSVTDAVTWVVTKPADGEANAENPPYVVWNTVSGAASYDFQIATSSAGVSGATPVNCPGSTYYTGTTIPAGSYRYWRVRAKNDNGNTTAYSTIYSFFYAWSYTLEATFPLDGATETGGDLTPTLQWTAVSGASSYDLQVNQNTPPTSGGVSCATNSYTTPPLGFGTLWYWRVRPVNSEGFAGAWSKSWSFTAK